MKLRLAILLLLLVPVGLQANPAMFNPQSFFAFCVVAFWALVIESGIATLTLSLCGVLVLPVFTTLVVTNSGDYVGVSWRRGLVASLLGNAASYFIGVIGSHTPWLTHETGGLD